MIQSILNEAQRKPPFLPKWDISEPMKTRHVRESD